MSKFIVVHEDGDGWDASECPKVVYGSKGEAVVAAGMKVEDNVKRAYLVCKVAARVAAVVSVGAVDEE